MSKYFRWLINILVYIYPLTAAVIAFATINSAPIFKNINQPIVKYILFELIIFLFLFIECWFVTYTKWRRNRQYLRNFSLLIFGIILIVSSVIIIRIYKVNAISILISLLSALVGFPTVINFIFKDNTDVMPCIYSKNIDTNTSCPTIDLSKDSKIVTTLKNFSNNFILAALVGVFNKDQYKELKKKAHQWRRSFYFDGIDQKDAIALYLDNNNCLNYNKINPYSESKPRNIGNDLFKCNGTVYVTYIDVFYKPHAIKLKITQSKDGNNNRKNRNKKQKLNEGFKCQKFKLLVIHCIDLIYNFFAKYIYLIKRLLITLILSAFELIAVTLWYGINFHKIKKEITSFLRLPLFIDKKAIDVLSVLFLIILIVLPVLIIITSIFRIRKINQSSIILSIHEKEKREHIIFQMFSYFLWSIAMGLIITTIVSWNRKYIITDTMIWELWFVLLSITTNVVLIISELFEWLKKDNNGNNNLPRTTMFVGFVAAVLAALIGHI